MFRYEYNLAGGLTTETYPSGRVLTFGYNSAGEISNVTQQANQSASPVQVASATYASHGPLATLSYGTTGISETTLFNNRLQPTQTTAGAWQSKLFYCSGGSSNCTTNNGNILRQEGFLNAAWDYQYDELNRLWHAQEKVSGANTWQQRFCFDPHANRALVNEQYTLIPNVQATPRVAQCPDPSPFNARNQWDGANYDTAGNQITTWDDGTASGAAKYYYDAENRLKRAEVNWPTAGLGVIEYLYDGEGRRVKKKVGGVVTTTWVYDAMGQLAAEYGEGTAMPCTTCYLTADHLGSTRVLWGPDGAR